MELTIQYYIMYKIRFQEIVCINNTNYGGTNVYKINDLLFV